MKRYFLSLALVSALSAQTPSTTPNIGLYVPVHGTLNWDVWYTNNWNNLDNIFGGSTTVPALNPKILNGVEYATLYAGGDLGAKINAAITACPSTGCEIDIPAGTYTITTQIAVSKVGIHLHGAGKYNTILNQGFTGDLVAVTADHFTADAIEFNGAQFSTGWSLIHGISSNFGHVFNCSLIDTRTPAFNSALGIRVEGNGNAGAANAWNIHDNFIQSPWIGVSLANNANLNAIHDNVFYKGGEAFDFNGNGAFANNATDNSFEHNFIQQGFGASFLESVSGSRIIGNTFFFAGGSSSDTIYVHLAGGTAQRRTIISGNHFLGSTATAACLHLYDNTQETLVSGNIFDSCGTDGIQITVQAGAVANLTIDGNIFRNNGQQSATAGFAAIRAITTGANAPLANSTISNNVAYDDQGTPTQTWGFATIGGVAMFQVYVHGNEFSRNKTAALFFATAPLNSLIGPNAETLSTINFQSAITSTGTLRANHVGGNGSTPAAACGAVAGTCTGVSVVGNDQSGTVNATFGTTAPSSGGTVLSLTFATAYGTNAHCTISPANPFAATEIGSVYLFPAGTNGFSILNTGGGLTSNQAHNYNYVCGF